MSAGVEDWARTWTAQTSIRNNAATNAAHFDNRLNSSSIMNLRPCRMGNCIVHLFIYYKLRLCYYRMSCRLRWDNPSDGSADESEWESAQDMLTRFAQWQRRKPASVAADAACGNREFLRRCRHPLNIHGQRPPDLARFLQAAANLQAFAFLKTDVQASRQADWRTIPASPPEKRARCRARCGAKVALLWRPQKRLRRSVSPGSTNA